MSFATSDVLGNVSASLEVGQCRCKVGGSRVLCGGGVLYRSCQECGTQTVCTVPDGECARLRARKADAGEVGMALARCAGQGLLPDIDSVADEARCSCRILLVRGVLRGASVLGGDGGGMGTEPHTCGPALL